MLLLCWSTFTADAATYVSGLIATNTTWTKANSPYIVNGSLAVDSTVTLTIEPGVTVRVDSACLFYVDGRLIAEGTVTDSILFLPNNTANQTKYAWAGIKFRIKGKNDTSSIKYCRFERGYNAIMNEGTNLYVYNSVFRNNTTAINLWPSPPVNYHATISKCLLTQNENGVINGMTSNVPTVFTENELSYNNVGYSSQGGLAQALIANNSFNYNAGGVNLQGGTIPGMTGNTFKGNTGAGVYIVALSLSSPISGNLFIYNDRALVINNLDTGSITNNTLAYNNIGIEHSQNAFNFPNPSGIVIDSNCFTNNVSFNYKESSPIDFQVKNNWWGTASTQGIDSTIEDFYDNLSSGKIGYTPFLTASDGCMAVSPPPQGIPATPMVAGIQIYPSPNNGTFTLQIDNSNFKKAAVQVYDMMGRECYKASITAPKSQITLNQAKGTYILKLRLDQTVVTKQLIVE
ncbi:NosD domain-containing protein [Polluticoccus soli]|uniref:NosD domain-containing protein n=1 Tax=Polluticoccus soli TaxID=3034150 RepID=UPI0023E2B6F1|nr:NosD domain-containing protein [Flavipsychrobacter sp. JY13-12]